MELIDEEVVNGQICRYYHGIDFDMIKSHSKDGSDGFVVFLIESFIKEIKNHNRNRKLNSLLKNSEFIPVDTTDMAHDFVGIYQYEGIGLKTMLDVVKRQIREYNSDLLWRKNTDEYH
jgi:hypothetical protein